MYSKWIKFKKNKKNISEATQCLVDTAYDRTKKIPKEKIENEIFSNFVEENQNDLFNVNTCILKDFPLGELAIIINRFVTCGYSYTQKTNWEIGKIIYILWKIYDRKWNDNFKSQPHNLIFEAIQKIKTKVRDMHKRIGDTHEEYEKYKSEEGGVYPNFQLLGFYKLFDEKEGIEMLKRVCTKRYDDAQDMLMFGIYQYPTSFYPHLKEIILSWHKNDNIDVFGSHSGMVGQMGDVIRKYKKDGIDILHDPDLQVIFEGDYGKHGYSLLKKYCE